MLLFLFMDYLKTMAPVLLSKTMPELDLNSLAAQKDMNISAFHVVNESPSQFNREYKRLFGSTSGKDAINYSDKIQQ